MAAATEACNPHGALTDVPQQLHHSLFHVGPNLQVPRSHSAMPACIQLSVFHRFPMLTISIDSRTRYLDRFNRFLMRPPFWKQQPILSFAARAWLPLHACNSWVIVQISYQPHEHDKDRVSKIHESTGCVRYLGPTRRQTERPGRQP